MTVSVILFGVAALGGVVLALQRLRGQLQPSLPLALVHGGVAAAGLVALLLAVLGGEAPGLASIALILFLGAALGGFILFATHLRKKALPVPLVLIHGAGATIAFVLLLVAVLQGAG